MSTQPLNQVFSAVGLILVFVVYTAGLLVLMVLSTDDGDKTVLVMLAALIAGTALGAWAYRFGGNKLPKKAKAPVPVVVVSNPQRSLAIHRAVGGALLTVVLASGVPMVGPALTGASLKHLVDPVTWVGVVVLFSIVRSSGLGAQLLTAAIGGGLYAPLCYYAAQAASGYVVQPAAPAVAYVFLFLVFVTVQGLAGLRTHGSKS
jgi:hypothetical protein